MPVINVQGSLGDMLNLVNPQTGETVQVAVEDIFKNPPSSMSEQWGKEDVWDQRLDQLKDIPVPQPNQLGYVLVYQPTVINGVLYKFTWEPK